MDAIVTMKFKLENICDDRDLESMQMTFEEIIKYMLKEEGLFNLTDDQGEVISIEKVL